MDVPFYFIMYLLRNYKSARKRPIPYRRPTPSTPTSTVSSRSSHHSWSRSPRPDNRE